MVVKFLKNKKGGSTKSLDYLLNKKRVENGTARVLKGSEEITRQIIDNLPFKQKVTFGVLSFEELNINQQDKLKIMEDFEKVLLCNMQERVNIIWIEHTDKGRLELNFVIPKIDLQTQKSFNPYYYKSDFNRINSFQELVNINYNLTSPKDPSKANMIQGSKKEINLIKDFEELNAILLNAVADSKITNREILINFLKQNKIEVNRQGKDYISVKLPNSKKSKRFKGSIYSEEFTSIGAIKELHRRTEQTAREYNSRDIRKEIDGYNREIARGMEYKNAEILQKYGKYEQKTFRGHAEQSRSNNKQEMANNNILRNIYNWSIVWNNGNNNIFFNSTGQNTTTATAKQEAEQIAAKKERKERDERIRRRIIKYNTKTNGTARATGTGTPKTNGTDTAQFKSIVFKFGNTIKKIVGAIGNIVADITARARATATEQQDGKDFLEYKYATTTEQETATGQQERQVERLNLKEMFKEELAPASKKLKTRKIK